MIDLINIVYKNIQNLQIPPTRHNIMLIADCLVKLEEIYRKAQAKAEVKTEEQKTEENTEEAGSEEAREE